MEYTRAEAARILLTASSHRGMLPRIAELIRLVTARTGLGQPEAERRAGRRRRWYGEGADPDLSPRRPLCLPHGEPPSRWSPADAE
jgi:hypothetical protein